MVDCATPIPLKPAAVAWPDPPPGWARQLGSPDSAQTSARVESGDSVHVWAASLQVTSERLQSLASLLSPDEQARAARFHFPLHRNRFIAGRGMLRSLLGTYLGLEPQTLAFCYGPNGKPTLSGSTQPAELSFNVAHAEDLLLIAVTPNAALGVDVERVRELSDAEELVARFFSPNECSRFRQLPAEQKPAAFYNLWTRKEAWLKATGEGIGHLLNQVEVSFLPAEPARLLRLPDKFVNRTFWSLYELTPNSGYAAALAIGRDKPRIHCWRYACA